MKQQSSHLPRHNPPDASCLPISLSLVLDERMQATLEFWALAKNRFVQLPSSMHTEFLLSTMRDGRAPVTQRRSRGNASKSNLVPGFKADQESNVLKKPHPCLSPSKLLPTGYIKIAHNCLFQPLVNICLEI